MATSKSPISIDWKSVFDSSSPPREVDVVAYSSPQPQPPASDPKSSDGEGDGDAAEFEKWSDHRLREQIQRTRTMPQDVRAKLPDRGAKARRLLRKMERELGRRLAAAGRRKDAEACKRMAQSNSKHDTFAFDSSDELDLNNSACKFLLKSSSAPSMKKNYNQDKGAFSKELSFFSRDKFTSLKKDRQIRFISVDEIYSSKLCPRTSMGHQQRIRAVVPKGADHKSCLHIEDDISNNFIKRRKASKHQDSSYTEFKKVQDVVLLDDEDAQSVESVDGGMADKWDESKIYYLSRNDPGAVELTYSDIKCLEPEVYLSSPVINFYIQYLKKSRFLDQGPGGNLHIFNTYFYSKLEEALSGKGERSSQFLKLRRWWKGVDIFQKAYIILPIHGKMHWSLIIICMPGKETESGPMILHLDSLELHSSAELFEIIESYLEAEWRHVRNDAAHGIPFSERIWNHLPRKTHREKVAVPRQQNEYDCGIFMLYYIERFIREAPERLTRENLHIDMFGRKWFKPEAASGLRERIRALLSEEFESARLEDGISVSGTHSDDGSEGEEDKDRDIVMTIKLESSEE